MLKIALISKIVCNDKISIIQSLSGKRIQQKLFFFNIRIAIHMKHTIFPHFLSLDIFLLVLRRRRRRCRVFFLVQCIFEINCVYERLNKSVYCAANPDRNQISLNMGQLSQIVIIFTTLSCDTEYNFFPCIKTCCIHAIAIYMYILYFGEPLHFLAHMCSHSLQFFECSLSCKYEEKRGKKRKKMKYAFQSNRYDGVSVFSFKLLLLIISFH